MKIYIVIGTVGSYSDREEWPVLAFSDPAQARTWADLAQEKAASITKQISKLKRGSKDSYERKEELLRTNEFDPDMKDSMWDDDSDYWLMEVEFRG